MQEINSIKISVPRKYFYSILENREHRKAFVLLIIFHEIILFPRLEPTISDLKLFATITGKSTKTIKNYLRYGFDLGFLKRKNNRIVALSYSNYFRGIKSRRRKPGHIVICIDPVTIELSLIAAYFLEDYKQQYNARELKMKLDVNSELGPAPMLTQRRVARKLGFKNHRTGFKLKKKLEEMEIIKIIKVNSPSFNGALHSKKKPPDFFEPGKKGTKQE